MRGVNFFTHSNALESLAFFIGQNVMKKLIEVSKNVIGNSEVNAVSARDIHKFVGSKQDFSHWIKSRLKQLGALQGVDFIDDKIIVKGINNLDVVKSIEYYVTIDIAKHLGMMERNENGYKIRQYFIDIEKNETVKALPSMSEAANAAVIFAEAMRLPDSGKLMLFETVNKSYGSPMTLPSYAIDSGTQVSGSSRATFSVTHLLKEHEANISPIAFNKLLEEDGLIVTLSRESFNKGKAVVKPYKSVTEKGLAYGKNVTSPQNPRETQPHWFGDSFSELLNELGL